MSPKNQNCILYYELIHLSYGVIFTDTEIELVRRPLRVITSRLRALTAPMFRCITLVTQMFKRTFFSVTPHRLLKIETITELITSFGPAPRLSGASQICWFLTGVSLDTDTRRPVGEIMILRGAKFLILLC